MEHLELEHIVNYFTHGLAFSVDNGHGISSPFEILSGVDTYLRDREKEPFQYEDGEILVYSLIDISSMWSIKEIKPHLRPLSDCSKEISQNGETFIPNERLKSLGLPTYVIGMGWQYDTVAFLPIQSKKTFDKLYEWKFDVAEFKGSGLIDQGLAIDINTLKS